MGKNIRRQVGTEGIYLDGWADAVVPSRFGRLSLRIFLSMFFSLRTSVGSRPLVLEYSDRT